MLRDIGVVYRKEMLEVVRDRKTLVFMIVLPLLLMPVLMQLVTDYMRKTEQKAQTETIAYVLVGAEQLPALGEAFAQAPGFEAKRATDVSALAEAIEAEELDLGLVVVPPPEPGGQLEIEMHYDNASTTSKVKARAMAVIEEVEASVRRQRLGEVGIDEPETQAAVLEPMVVVERGTASSRERIGELFGGILPYFLIPFCFLGALYPAIDLGAGEKERGTLETLLLSPLPRSSMVLGKFLVIFTTGVVAATLVVAGLGTWLAFKSSDMGGVFGEIVSAIGPLDLTLIAMMLLPTTAMMSALLLSISIYAKSFKEAQSYATPLNLLIVLPVMFAMLPGVELDWTWAMVPVTNVALAIKELVKGTVDYQMLSVILVSSTAVAAALLWAAIRWFNQEAVLFRQ